MREVLRVVGMMPPARARAVLGAILSKDRTERTDRTDAEGLQEARRAFERDMQPIVSAVVEALKDGDNHALKGLKALLPELLREVNEEPELADLLTQQLGMAMMRGIMSKPEEVL
jgi:phage gp29-like protein